METQVSQEKASVWTPIRLWDWQGLADRFEPMARKVGIERSDMKAMINPLMVIASRCMCIDITKFGDWMETNHPEYGSVEEFLKAKDPDHIDEWKHLFGMFQSDVNQTVD